MANERKLWKVELTYFKRSGKMYTSEIVEIEADVLVSGGQQKMPYVYEIVDAVRTMRSERKLSALQSGYWEGYILVSPLDGFPTLITLE